MALAEGVVKRSDNMMSRSIRSILVVSGLALNAGAAKSQLLQAPRSATVPSKILREKRRVFIAVPASYARGDERYPVVYVTDAEWIFEHTRSAAQFLARNRAIPEVIVVGITTPDRVHDLYATRADFSANGQTLAFPTSGNADRFLEFLDEELVPWVERAYRTSGLRILIGHSAGGNFALHAMRAKPSLFQGVLAASPWLSWDEGRELRELVLFVQTDALRVRRIFLSHGEDVAHMKANIETLVGAIQKRADRRVELTVREYTDESHDTDAFKAIYDGLRAMFAGFGPPRDVNSMQIIGSLGDLRSHFARLGQRFGVSLDPPEEVVNELAAQYLTADSIANAVAVLEFNVLQHPRSPDAWRQLGIATERQGDRHRALEHFRKALLLATRQKRSDLAVFRRHVVAAR